VDKPKTEKKPGGAAAEDKETTGFVGNKKKKQPLHSSAPQPAIHHDKPCTKSCFNRASFKMANWRTLKTFNPTNRK